MPSPFPGMNPFLEREEVWQDFHQSFIPLVREILTGASIARMLCFAAFENPEMCPTVRSSPPS